MSLGRLRDSETHKKGGAHRPLYHHWDPRPKTRTSQCTAPRFGDGESDIERGGVRRTLSTTRQCLVELRRSA